MTFESKYALGDAIYYDEATRNIRHSGVIIAVTFSVNHPPEYKVDTSRGVTYGVPEEFISLKENL